MKALLFISAVLSFGFAMLLFLGARGAMHETTSAVFFVVSAVSFSGAGVIEAIHTVRDELRKAANPPA